MLTTCPIPISEYPRVLMAHGGGGRLMHNLISRMFSPAFDPQGELGQHDGALLDVTAGRIAFTTDSFVVNPLFFPGGDIGKLAVDGTVNDLAMCGAKPAWLSAGFIIEEGLPMETLWRVVESMRREAADAGVRIVTGDTKVVDRGKGDGVFLNTAGIGHLQHQSVIGPASVLPGDVVILSGDVGRHGIAVMAAREGLEFETTLQSDVASLWPSVQALLESGVSIHCLRDLTRGGLSTVLVEIAQSAALRISFDESCVPVSEEVRGACELLGFDPFYVANEGRMVVFVPEADADRALGALRNTQDSKLTTQNSRVIGHVETAARPGVIMRSLTGVSRIVEMLSGEQLPRIC